MAEILKKRGWILLRIANGSYSPHILLVFFVVAIRISMSYATATKQNNWLKAKYSPRYERAVVTSGTSQRSNKNQIEFQYERPVTESVIFFIPAWNSHHINASNVHFISKYRVHEFSRGPPVETCGAFTGKIA